MCGIKELTPTFHQQTQADQYDLTDIFWISDPEIEIIEDRSSKSGERRRAGSDGKNITGVGGGGRPSSVETFSSCMCAHPCDLQSSLGLSQDYFASRLHCQARRKNCAKFHSATTQQLLLRTQPLLTLNPDRENVPDEKNHHSSTTTAPSQSNAKNHSRSSSSLNPINSTRSNRSTIEQVSSGVSSSCQFCLSRAENLLTWLLSLLLLLTFSPLMQVSTYWSRSHFHFGFFAWFYVILLSLSFFLRHSDDVYYWGIFDLYSPGVHEQHDISFQISNSLFVLKSPFVYLSMNIIRVPVNYAVSRWGAGLLDGLMEQVSTVHKWSSKLLDV